MSANRNPFIHWVQMRERVWGNETYIGRLSLEDILASPVVTFWRPVKSDGHLRYKIRLFDTRREIEQYMTKLLFCVHIDPPKESLSRIYVHRKQIMVKAAHCLYRRQARPACPPGMDDRSCPHRRAWLPGGNRAHH
jgi:hypothetical protein